MFRERREGWVGVDRGAGSVKVVQLRRVEGALRANVAAITPRWNHAADTPLGDDQRCRRELDSVRALVGSWRTGQAAATASMDLCTLSTTEDEAPGAKSAFCSDTWGAADQDRYTLSAPEEEVQALCDGLRLAGLQCRVIDGLPLTLARALRLAPQAGDQLVVGLDWGVSGATLVGARNGRAVYARKLKDSGFGAVLEEVAETLGLARSEAETLVRRHGVASAQTGAGVAATVSDALAHATVSIVGEARRTLSHLSAKLKTKGPERLWGFGVGATPPGLMERVGERLGVPAEPWRSEAVSFDASNEAPPCLFGPAIALSALAWEA